MSLLRYDVTTNDWVIFAPERSRRPHERKELVRQNTSPEGSSNHCPFCPGNEQLTGPEIYAVRNSTSPNSPGWSVRVIPNKFPALRIEEESRRFQEGAMFRFMEGCGAHEVNRDDWKGLDAFAFTFWQAPSVEFEDCDQSVCTRTKMSFRSSRGQRSPDNAVAT